MGEYSEVMLYLIIALLLLSPLIIVFYRIVGWALGIGEVRRRIEANGQRLDSLQARLDVLIEIQSAIARKHGVQTSGDAREH